MKTDLFWGWVLVCISIAVHFPGLTGLISTFAGFVGVLTLSAAYDEYRQRRPEPTREEVAMKRVFGRRRK